MFCGWSLPGGLVVPLDVRKRWSSFSLNTVAEKRPLKLNADVYGSNGQTGLMKPAAINVTLLLKHEFDVNYMST